MMSLVLLCHTKRNLILQNIGIYRYVELFLETLNEKTKIESEKFNS